MNLNLGHITGLCLDAISILKRPSVFMGVIFFLALLRVLVIFLRTFFYGRRLLIQAAPKTIFNLGLKHGLSSKIIIIAGKKPLAFCHGFFKPKIYLSTGLLKLMDRRELEAIILHEKYHLLKNDNIFLVAANFAKQLFALFPVIADLIDNSIRDKEIGADRYGAELMGNKRSVSSAFKKLLSFGADNYSPLHYSPTFTNHQHLEARIHALFGKKPLSFSLSLRNLSISVLSLVILVGFSFYPWQKSQANNQDQKSFVCLENTDCGKHC